MNIRYDNIYEFMIGRHTIEKAHTIEWKSRKRNGIFWRLFSLLLCLWIRADCLSLLFVYYDTIGQRNERANEPNELCCDDRNERHTQIHWTPICILIWFSSFTFGKIKQTTKRHTQIWTCRLTPCDWDVCVFVLTFENSDNRQKSVTEYRARLPVVAHCTGHSLLTSTAAHKHTHIRARSFTEIDVCATCAVDVNYTVKYDSVLPVADWVRLSIPSKSYCYCSKLRKVFFFFFRMRTQSNEHFAFEISWECV